MWSVSLRRPFGVIPTRRIPVFTLAILMALFISLYGRVVSAQVDNPSSTIMATWEGDNLRYGPATFTRSSSPESDQNVPGLIGTQCENNQNVFYSPQGERDDDSQYYWMYVICLTADFDGDKSQTIPARLLEYRVPRSEHELNVDTARNFNEHGEVREIVIQVAPEGTDENGRRPGEASLSTTCDSRYTHGIGWIICPVTYWLSNMMDFIYKLLVGFLTITPISTDRDSVMYYMWNAMRNIANILFIIGFLIIIYSQATSIGISNYGIKRLLPRLMIAAILVNISYWIVAIGVDASNIIGVAIKDLFDQIAQSVPTNGSAAQNGEWSWAAIAGATLTGGVAVAGLTSVAVGIAASAGASLYFLLPALMGVIVSALVAILVLAARQAVVTILVIISPLAFVAYLLPSTEGYFDRWRTLFMTMLLVFPAFSVIFGGSELAGKAIIHSANPESENYFNVIILGLIVQVAPLIITPILIKLSGSLIGRIAGIVNDPNRGLIDSTRKFAQARHDMRKNQQMWELDKNNPSRYAHNNPLAWGARKLALRERNKQHKLKVYEGGIEAAYEQDQRAHILFAENATNEMLKSAGQNEAKAEFEKQKATNNTLLTMDIRSRKAADEAEYQARHVANKYEDIKATTDPDKIQKIFEARSPDQDVAIRSIMQYAKEAHETALKMQSETYHLDAAKRTGNLSYAEEIKKNREFAEYAGGVDDYGLSRAIAKAQTDENKAFNEAVDYEKSTMSRTSAAELTSIMKDVTISVERRSAAAGTLMKRGGAQDIIDTFNWVATTDPSKDSAIVTIQQQIADDVGPRKPAAVGEGAMAELSRGNLRTDMDKLMMDRILAGKMTGAGLAQMPKEELQHMRKVIMDNPNLRTSKAFRNLQSDIEAYRTDPTLAGTQPPPEKRTIMDEIWHMK